MRKQTQLKVADSNLAGVGGAEDKAARLKKANAEPAWKGAGDACGLEIWRVENQKAEGGKAANFGVKRWPKDKYGQFYDGDSFIVLHTYMQQDKKLYDVFFWIGNESTQDEYGTAAYKTTELDDFLGGAPVQHREVQGGESARFLSLFKNGITIMKGGIEGGFNKVKPREYQPRLLQVEKVGPSIKCYEVTCDISSLHDGDSFILDAGSNIYVWSGAGASPFEKNKATSTAEQLESERGSGCERVDADANFWALLGGDESQVPTEAAAKSMKVARTEPELFALDGTVWRLVKTGILQKSDIDVNDVMIINVGTHVFVCVGSGAPEEEKMKCMVCADAFLTDKKLPRSTPVMRIMVPDGRAFKTDNGFLACFAEEVKNTGWMAKRVGVRPLFKRYFTEMSSSEKTLTFYESEDMKDASGGVINLNEVSSVQRSVAPTSGAEEMEIVTSGRTYRIRFDDAEELSVWLQRLNTTVSLRT